MAGALATRAYRTDGVYLVIVPDGPDSFVVQATDPKSEDFPAGGMVVIPTLLAETYWVDPYHLAEVGER